jgi:hypothetical protein
MLRCLTSDPVVTAGTFKAQWTGQKGAPDLADDGLLKGSYSRHDHRTSPVGERRTAPE